MRDWLEALEIFAEDVILERRYGRRAKVLRVIFWILSFLTALTVRLRCALFQIGIFRQRAMGCLVISVGNLTVGGTGKTPVVEMLAHHLQASGRKVAILSRGYKRRPESFFRRILSTVTCNTEFVLPLIVSDGRTLLLDSKTAGDEPFMLANNLRGVIVLVDHNRTRSGLFAIEHFGADVLLLDDGFQYLRMRHAIEIVLVDQGAPFGNEFLLPRGTLREPVQHLSRATHILITKCSNGEDNSALVARIRKLNRTADIVECTHHPQHLTNLWTGEIRSLTFLKNLPIAALCGIATPEHFINALVSLGARLVLSLTYADHHHYSSSEIHTFMQRCVRCNLQAILTTEKDAVRMPNLTSTEVPIYFIRVGIKIIHGNKVWKSFIKRLTSLQKVQKPVFR